MAYDAEVQTETSQANAPTASVAVLGKCGQVLGKAPLPPERPVTVSVLHAESGNGHSFAGYDANGVEMWRKSLGCTSIPGDTIRITITRGPTYGL